MVDYRRAGSLMPARVAGPEGPRLVADSTVTAHMRPLFGIGELSRRSGIPASTIRTWQNQGLTLGVRTEGGHRRFGDADAERLNRFVRLLQTGGLTVRGAISAMEAEDSPLRARGPRPRPNGW